MKNANEKSAKPTKPAARELYVTKYDLDRLTELIRERAGSAKDETHLRELEQELALAKVVDPHEVPADVVTMNSTVKLKDQDSGEEMTYTIVFPEAASLDDGKISVLAPIGTAILGYRVGSEIEWNVPAGLTRLRIESILYQPEAAGDFHL
jgi:regulator of nucleoside diphosphate kinase